MEIEACLITNSLIFKDVIKFVKRRRNVVSDFTTRYLYYNDDFVKVVKEIDYFQKEKYYFAWLFIKDFDKFLYIKLNNEKEFLEIKKIISKIKACQVNYLNNLDNLINELEKNN